jgi:hypothetical protein
MGRPQRLPVVGKERRAVRERRMAGMQINWKKHEITFLTGTI